MILTLVSSHNSIRELPDTTLPDFTLITGLNGSGKSHLLQAIQQGKIQADIAPNFQSDARFFDSSTMAPNDTGGISSGQLAQERDGLYQAFLGHRKPHESQFWQAARSHGLSVGQFKNVAELSSLSEQQLGALVSDRTKVPDLVKSLENATTHISSSIINHMQPDQRSELTMISKACGKPIAALEEDDFKLSNAPYWGRSQPFQNQFGRLFMQYKELQKTNDLRAYHGQQHSNDAEFQQKHMMPPWDFVNDTLQRAALPFLINEPDKFENIVFTPKLTKTTTGDEIQFANLSSGEKIIMSFALCLYYAGEGRQITTYPKLLLLDEVDAPLHPSMCGHFITTVTETLVKKLGVNVIATTHSPSTVALAPEESIHVMRVGEPGVHKTTKAEALNLLTVGVPTLSLNYDGRRQVFVESPNDAEIYSALYEILRPKLGSERSLTFVSAGSINPKSGTHENAGCDKVISIVDSLSQNGNNTVFGLLDWDLKKSSRQRIHVLAEDKRYAVENCIYDPLAMIALLLHTPESKQHVATLGLPENTTFVSFVNMDWTSLQATVDALAEKITGKVGNDPTDSVEYFGGHSLTLPRAYLQMQGHQLEEKIVSAFPELKAQRFGNNLMLYMVKNIYSQIQELVPKHIVNAFERLLTADSHQP